MKYAHWTATAALLALGVYGAIPSSAEGWYTPSKGFTKQGGTGTVYYGYDKNSGTWQTTTVTVDENGNLEGGMNTFGRDYELRTAYEALVKACYNKAINDQQDEMIQTIGKNLDSVFRTDGIKMEMTKHGPGGDKTTVTYTLKIKPGEGGNAGSVTAEDPTPYGDVVDGRTIGWTRNDEYGQLQLYGSKLGPMSTDQWWADDGFVVPFLKGGSVLGWKKFGGIDKVVFESRASAGDLTLKGFHSNGGCSERLTDILTEESSVQRDLHQIVCRYGTGDSAVIHYLPIGSVLPSSAPFDDKSVTTNDTGRVHIVDVGDAVEGQVLSSDGAAGVAWVNPSPVVSYDDVDYYLTITPGGNDDTGDTYVPLPYAYIEETEDGYVFTYRLPGNMEEEELVTIPKAGGVKFDDVTLTTNETGVAHIVGYSDDLGGNQYVGTDSGGTWGVHGLPVARVDAYSVVTNASQHEGEIALAGFWDNATEDGMFPVKSGGTLAWVHTNNTECAFRVDDASITTNESNGATTANAASLYGWKDAAVGALPSKKSNGKIDWSKLDENTLSFTTLNGAPVIGFNLWNYNYSGDIPVVPANVGGVLTYVGLPPIHPPDNNSLEYVSNSGVTNLQIKGWKDQSECGANLMSMLTRSGDENRATHSILCRVGNGEGGYSLHYLPVGGGVMMDVDGHSIVTNAQDHANEAALAGFWEDETEDGMFPVKSGDTLAWVPTNSMSSAFKADGHSIVTNVPGHLGDAAIYGYWDASSAGDVLTRTAGGLAWSPVRVQVDDASISSNNNVVALYGFEGAEENMMPHKENGRLVWGGVSAVTNTILAGAGIVITDNGGGAITISADPFAVENMMNTATIVTAAKYDTDTHKFQIKTRQIVFRGTLGTESEWTDVFEATSHKGEHQAEEQ